MKTYVVEYVRGPMRSIGLPTIDPPFIERSGPSVTFDEKAYAAFRAFVGRLGPFAVDGVPGQYASLDYDDCFEVMEKRQPDVVAIDEVADDEDGLDDEKDILVVGIASVSPTTVTTMHVATDSDEEEDEEDAPTTKPQFTTWLKAHNVPYKRQWSRAKLETLYLENQ